MQTQAERNRIAINVWTARIIPVILTSVVGYATYVLVALLCGKIFATSVFTSLLTLSTVQYVLREYRDKAAAIPILTIYVILFLLMATSFFRLVYITVFDPPYLPLGLAAHRDQAPKNARGKTTSEEDSIGGGEYYQGTSSVGPIGTKNDPDSPGLELFYTKDVFICEMDGKPRWCSSCANWKPDRTHHCSDAGRCIERMDHFCPWYAIAHCGQF